MNTAPSVRSKPSVAERGVTPERYVLVVRVAAVLLAGIVFTGAAVRLTQSGLGCEDWPTCSEDRLVPEWGFHSWIEFGNRLLSGAVAAGVAIAVLFAYRRRPRRGDLIAWAWGLVVGVVAQIVLGGITVLVDLHPLFVGGHFLLSIILLWNALVLLRRASTEPGPTRPIVSPALIRHGRAVVVLATLVVTIGTLVTGAGPHGGDVDAERLDLALTSIARLHSLSAWLLVAASVGLALRLGATGLPGPTTWSRRVIAVAVAQGGIGYWQYATGVPAGLVEAHIVGSVALWCATIWLYLTLFEPTRTDFRQ